jgi:hypothetical protein
VGNATARATLFAPRNRDLYIYPDDPDSYWKTAFIGGSHEFLLQPGVRDLDGRTMFFYYATMVTPAMTRKMVGVGSQYAIGDRDANGNHLDGSKTYRLTLPPNPPAKDFWSIVVYDNQTRSMLQSMEFPSLNSHRAVQPNADGSYTIYFGPKAPAGKESNWVKTIPGKGWNMLLRLYGPLEPWFDKTWRPGDIELIK